MRTVPQKRHGDNEAGFSLAELIVVVILLGIITAAVVPVFAGSISKMKTQSALDEFIALFKYAHERAIMNAVEYRLYLDHENDEYWIVRQTIPEKEGDTDQEGEEEEADSRVNVVRAGDDELSNRDREERYYFEEDGKTFEPLDGAFGEVQRFPEQIDLERPKAKRDRDRDAMYVSFYPSGACDYATVELRVEDRAKRVSIETKGQLGHFKVEGRKD